ncbi:phosphotransferase system eiib component type 2/3 [Lucifera butyrica]|uniref:Phosphotransferase system eiib component type 2/3 n=1 Tax=Lucifera butyrica TaxID=1351585 RepID=A0A498RFC7_9FIRM|nr:PTS sugar transporter subunit IIB [Lucifera butyrica]VBB09715.1 phosphotransferase system eiib component type 2/3 [Lucifera butyrica]
MIKIFTVCPQGLGSSMIAKINVRGVLDKFKIDGQVETAGLASIIGESYDFIVTVEELKDSFKNVDPNKIIFIKNFFKKDDIEEKLLEKINELKKNRGEI